ncbi:MAG: flagellar basal body-associated FliL family protein [Limisphaerales bacterium]
MAINPKETGAPAAAAAGAAKGGKGALLAWLPLGLAVVLMPALAFATTNFLLIPKLRKELGLTGAPAAAAPAEAGAAPGATPGAAGSPTTGAKESVPMNKLLVNVAGTMGSRFLLTSLTLVGSSADFRRKVEDRDAQLRDLACSILAAKTIVDLEKPGARNVIRSELQNAFNGILGDSSVKDIFFTDFAIQ